MLNQWVNCNWFTHSIHAIHRIHLIHRLHTCNQYAECKPTHWLKGIRSMEWKVWVHGAIALNQLITCIHLMDEIDVTHLWNAFNHQIECFEFGYGMHLTKGLNAFNIFIRLHASSPCAAIFDVDCSLSWTTMLQSSPKSCWDLVWFCSARVGIQSGKECRRPPTTIAQENIARTHPRGLLVPWASQPLFSQTIHRGAPPTTQRF